MPSLMTVIAPMRALATRLAYEIGDGRALENASLDARRLDQTFRRIDAIGRRVAPAATDVRRVA